MHRDATGWTFIPGIGGSDVIAVAPNDVFVAGAQLLHWDGTAWTDVGEPGVQYQHVWASGDDDVWVTTLSTFELHHYDGVAWSTVPVLGAALAVWGTGRGDAWVASEETTPVTGHVYEQSGTTLVDRFDVPMSHWVDAFAGTAPNDVWFEAVNGSALYHWDGTTASEIAMTWPINTDFPCGWARSSTEVYFCAGAAGLYQWNGTSLVQMPAPTSNRLFGMWGSGDRVWLVGNAGAILSHPL
jgi:hypothetical protein